MKECEGARFILHPSAFILQRLAARLQISTVVSDQRPCIRCHRDIDRSARSCVFCNWDQSVLPPTEHPPVASVHMPPPKTDVRSALLGIGALVAFLLAAFSVGALIHHLDNGNTKAANNAAAITAAPATRVPAPARSDIEVVPATGSGDVGTAPITTAPATTTTDGVPNEYQRSDATAATAAEYAQLAARARAEKQPVGVDPRTVSGPLYGGASTRSRHSALAANGAAASAPAQGVSGELQPSLTMIRTRAVPESQPIPAIHVDREATARLDLTIGPDGRVEDVAVLDSVPGQTARLIAAAQSWRFKPATENGVPVSSHFSVDISFKPDE
jgi:TonB family protein